MLRCETAPSGVNLCVCCALAPRPRLCRRRGVFGDVIPDESAGSTTDISGCVTGPGRGCRNRDTHGRCDDKRTNQSQGTNKRCAARPPRCPRVPHVELTPDNVLGTIVLMAMSQGLYCCLNLNGAPVKDPGSEAAPDGRRRVDCAAVKPTRDDWDRSLTTASARAYLFRPAAPTGRV